jgi:hypothetical protein
VSKTASASTIAETRTPIDDAVAVRLIAVRRD